MRYATQISDLRGRSAMQLLLLDGASATLQAVVSAEERCTSGLIGGHTENGLLLAWHAGRPGSAAVLGASLAATLQPACRSALAGVGAYVADSIAATSFRVPLAFMPETSVPANPLSPYRVLDVDLAAGGVLPSPSALSDLAALLDFGFGANPGQRVYMTAGAADCLLGSNVIRSPLRVDSLFLDGIANEAPPGITIIGPTKPAGLPALISAPYTVLNGILPDLVNPVDPSDDQWPFFEYYTDSGWGLMGEYTPHSTLGDQALQLGFYVGLLHEHGLASARNYSTTVTGRQDPKSCTVATAPPPPTSAVPDTPAPSSPAPTTAPPLVAATATPPTAAVPDTSASSSATPTTTPPLSGADSAATKAMSVALTVLVVSAFGVAFA